MDRAADGALADSLVREVALREGATAYLTGDVAVLGARYSISAQLVSAESGEVLPPCARRRPTRPCCSPP